MKKEFAQLVKDMRLALRSEFKQIVTAGLSTDEMDQKLSELEKKQDQMITESGYEPEEYSKLVKESFMDFSSPNPDEWIIRHDPENAQIIGGN